MKSLFEIMLFSYVKDLSFTAADEAVLYMGIPQPILTFAKEYGKLYHTPSFVEDVETLYRLCDKMVCIPDYKKQINR